MTWQSAELTALSIVQEYFPTAKLTCGSGSKNNDGDIAGIPGVFLDVKDQSASDGFTIRRKEWAKVTLQALKLDRFPVQVVRNKHGRLIAVCDLDVLMLALSHIPAEKVEGWRP